MCHPVEEVIGCSTSLTRRGTLGPGEGIHVLGRTRGFVSIDSFHVSLLAILVKGVPESAFPYRAMEGSVPFAPVPDTYGR